MNIETVTTYFYQYGGLAIFVIILLEYCNLPGFPAGIILPLAGVFAAKGKIGFFEALLISEMAGLCGSWILYFIGRYGGAPVLAGYMKRFPKQRTTIEKAMEHIKNKGYFGIFIGKLIPMFRTLVSIPAGILKMNFAGYTMYSALGILVWNAFFVGAGYFFGDAVFKLLKLS